jgi:hypothetical protein
MYSATEDGTMRLGCLMVGGAIACFVFGYKGLSDNLKFRKPVTMTAAEFIKKKPAEGWYHISETSVLLIEAKYSVYKSKYSTSSDSNDDISKASTIYLPVHAKDDLETPTTLVLKTDDPAIKATLSELSAANDLKDEKQAEAWLEKNRDRVLIHPNLSGMVASGIDDSSSDKAELAKLGEELGPDFVVLNDGHEPPAAFKSIGLFVLGIVLLPLAALGFGFRFNRTKPEEDLAQRN